MRALWWHARNDLRTETVPDPAIVNPHDAIVRVTMSTTCGSDLHLIGGFIPGMRSGSCWYCRQQRWSLCDNTNAKPELQELVLGHPTGAVYGYTHAFGGYAGGHAEYVRVPFADNDCFHVPESPGDEQAVFLSDAAPT